MRGFLDNLWSVAAAWLFAFSLCLGGWSLLGDSEAEQTRLERTRAAASTELSEAMAVRSPELAALTRAFLVREDLGLAWLRVRDAQGYPLAAAGRLEPAAGGSGWMGLRLRRLAYAAISSEHRLPIERDGRAVGSLELGLMSGTGGGAIAGVVILLLGVPALLLLSRRLGRVFAREWRAGETASPPVVKAPRRATPPPAPAVAVPRAVAPAVAPTASPRAAPPEAAPPAPRTLPGQLLENVITTDSQDRIHYANARALEQLSYTLTELRGQHISRLLPEPFLRPRARLADYAIDGSAEHAVTARRRDGSEFAATMSVQPVSQQGREGHVITLRRKVAALGDARIGPRLRQLLAATDGELLAVDPETLVVAVANASACEQLGYSPDELARMSLSRLIPKLEGAVLRDCLARVWRDPDTQVEADAVQLTASGAERPVRLRMSLWRLEAEPFLLVSAQPSARGRYPALRRGEETAEFLAEHDAATGLPNRRLFTRRLEAALGAQQPFAIAQLALTGVAEVAAAHSTDTVERLLRAVADRLCAVVGAADTVARIGLDEFALLLHGPALAREAQGLLRRHLTIFSRPFRAGLLEFQVGATAGVTAYPEDKVAAEALLGHAGAARHLARPGEIALYDPRSAERPEGDGLWRLREAQAAGELDVELQALTDTRARLIAGVEVLLAWRFGGRLLRSNAALREAGAEPPALEALPAWLFEQACEQHARWRDLELPALPLMVNASMLPLMRGDLHKLRGLLARYHVPAQHLVLLVNGADLEALLLEPDGWLSLARDMGLRLGVDDVASVRPDLLRRIDPDLVRLARATIAGLPAARQASEQTGAGIIAGQRIGALVLADGVERAEQREALINLGCYLQQGRLLGEPMAPRDFSRLLSRAEVGAF